MKQKLEALDKFEEFKHSIKIKSRRPLKILCCDNGGEYTSNEFIQFYKDNNIK